MIISNPFENPNSNTHRYYAHVILKLKANGINVFEFVKKTPGVLNCMLEDIEVCDAKFVNKLLQTENVKVMVLNKEDRMIARNWVV
jgi:hypothetical protein